MSSLVHESVYEGNQPIETEFNVVFINGPESQIIEMKFSSDQNFILLATEEGFKLYNLQKDELIINEENIKLGKIYSIDFFDNSVIVFVIGLDQNIVIWDYNQRQVIKKYPILQAPQQISFCNPFIIAGIKQLNENVILVLNVRTDQAYRYLYTQNLNGEIIYANNNNHFNCLLTYLNIQGNYLIIDFLHYQTLQGLNIKTITAMSDDQIIEYQQQSQSKQQTTSQFRSYSSVGYIQTCIAISSDSNLLAISPLVDNQRIYIFSISPSEQPKLKYHLYRGQTKKILSLYFGPNEMLACISFQNNIHKTKNDATIHLYYKMKEILENENKDQKSLTRLYFRTQSSEITHQKRTRLMLLLINKEKLQVFSGNQFKFEEQLQLDSNLVSKGIENYILWPKADPY
ncbi:unnamed protein product [Paramecium primaurelia]|uniref:Uncharacterized protein n=1 Tax=Paramecium primaurelia TaxID=5886 RepID=A0A8S1QJQ7_PARPR|nr:unnamed protein product [Paramecium primaurelia]CAD8115889.1 unnamed protein product [Paramecium primaurelia]